MADLLPGDYYVSFRAMQNYYQPAVTQLTIDVTTLYLTNFYRPFTHSLTVSNAGIVTATNVTWALTSYPNPFTNSSAYGTQFTNNYTLAPIPTGTYTVTFPEIWGYSVPAPLTTNITETSPLANTLRANYIRATNGTIRINVNISNASWNITNYPADALGRIPLSGTNSVTLSNVPSGEYSVRFNPQAGMKTPPVQIKTVSDDEQIFEGIYSYGWRLTVHVYDPDQNDPVPAYKELAEGGQQYYPAGIGYGTYRINDDAIAQGSYIEDRASWYFSDNTAVSITAIATNYNDGLHDYNSYYYRTFVRRSRPAAPGQSSVLEYTEYFPSQNPIPSLTMDADYDVWILFSREYYWYDNVGDVDADGLPDEWELLHGLNPLSAAGTNGWSGNPDGDWVPATSIQPPQRVLVSTNKVTSYLATDGTDPGYPLRGLRLYNPNQIAMGYAATNIPFHNGLECRGFDGYYKTNGRYGACPDDDPYTSPLAPDSNNNRNGQADDGWEYYFWYWRSADASSRGLSNSAGLSWVGIHPAAGRGTSSDWDTDGDGLTDDEEFVLGTDPTHADSDGDSMDDFWEQQYPSACHPLNSSDGTTNIDMDYFACSSNLLFFCEATEGTIGGPLFGYPVCFSGAEPRRPNAVWIDYYTNNGPNRFDLFHDEPLLIELSQDLVDGTIGQPFEGQICTVPFQNLDGTYITPGSLYRSGSPLWVDMNTNYWYDAGDIPLVNPIMKHDYVNRYWIDSVPADSDPAQFPGVTGFDPRTGWGLGKVETNEHPDTLEYVNYQEYMAGDYVGRLSWSPAGRVIYDNDGEGTPNLARAYTDPCNEDTDGDLIPDGWEFYVGLNPNDPSDAANDPDQDQLSNREEWSNATHPLSSCLASWPNKAWPTDPGVIVYSAYTNINLTRYSANNDAHPKDTDWDGITDGDERDLLTNPCSADTDGDMLPDGWELYAGTDPLVSDAFDDPDEDGLENWREYWTGTVPHWQMCDPDWDVYFCTRRMMPWDPRTLPDDPVTFIPPDWITCPSFLYYNGVYSLDYLYQNRPAASALGYDSYHTTRADMADSDGDGMDDFWEVFHGLSPLQGSVNLMGCAGGLIGNPDADPNEPGFQFGTQDQVFHSLKEFISYLPYIPPGSGGTARDAYLAAVVGPFNFGLSMMDPDADGLPNLEEYSYGSTNGRTYYHTCPTPRFFTSDQYTNSFVLTNYRRDWFDMNRLMPFWAGRSGPVFIYGDAEGFDTDGDGVGDYAEINNSAGKLGTDPLDERNPARNRVLVLDGRSDFARTLDGRYFGSELTLSRFCIEAWVCPNKNVLANNQVIVERAGTYPHPYAFATNMIQTMVRANFRLGLTNGLPYVSYNGRGAMTEYQATARLAHRLRPNTWTHLAGSYDGNVLMIYVNGEASASIYTTELPATGYDSGGANTNIFGRNHTFMVGAHDETAGASVSTASVVQAVDYYGGMLDEVRVWNGARTRDQIIANKNRRLGAAELTNSAILAYFTFDDVPDPRTEGVVPRGMDILDPTLSLHPTLQWWQEYPLRSTVYTGMAAQAYNYMVLAKNHYDHRPILPPLDDPYHYSTNNLFAIDTFTTNGYQLLPGYRNPSNPYGERSFSGQSIRGDLCFFNGAWCAATNSWLPTLTDDPDSTDSDGDGLPDWWEMLHGLDPYSADGDDGAWGDPDHDGLNNRAEYLANTDPRMWDSDGDGISDYDSRRNDSSRTWGELYMAGDGISDLWKVQHGLSTDYYIADQDPDGDGWDNYAEYQAGTDPLDPNSYPDPIASCTVSYCGTNDLASLVVLGYQKDSMDGIPLLTTTASDASINYTRRVNLSGFKGGDCYLFAFLDLNGNGYWDNAEPCGLARPQPVQVAWSDFEGVRIGLRDVYPGYGRFAWTAPASTSLVEVVINKISESTGPNKLTRSLRLPRYYFNEWDYQLAGIYGLPAGAYQWWVGNRVSGTFNVSWPASLSKPYVVSPRGDSLYYARHQIVWQMDPYSTLYHVQIADASSKLLKDYYQVPPYPDADGRYRDDLPFYTGEWTNGYYLWRIAGVNPAGESAWSDVQTFRINLSSTNSCAISGEIYYFGKARATDIYLEAFENPSFAGEPVARSLYRVACTTNALKVAYTLRGLQNKIYYLRAFTDITPAAGARNACLDYWESWGFAKDPLTDYQALAIDLTDKRLVKNIPIVIRDRDTDNDQMPDAWEMSYFGDLNQTGDMDYDRDGINNLTEYALDALDTDPTIVDTDGDGLSDYFEVHYGGHSEADYDPYHPILNPKGHSLSATSWDTDGDGYSDGAEILRYHTDPLDPGSYPLYRPPCYGPFAAAADYDGDGRSDLSIYEPGSALWHILTWQGGFIHGQFGTPSTEPLLGDFDGDGKTDAALYDPGSGNWYIYTMRDQFAALPFGGSSMIPVPADYGLDHRYHGDHRDSLGLYDLSTGMWYLYSPYTRKFLAFQFGNSACIPVPGDYDGDGKTDFAVYHTADHTWYIHSMRGEFCAFPFGRAGCIPLPGDYDGDGRCDVAVYEMPTGMWYIYTWKGQFVYGQFGWDGVIPVTGDYDGDGRRNVAIYYPPTGMWYIYTWSGQLYQAQFGYPAAMPISRGR